MPIIEDGNSSRESGTVIRRGPRKPDVHPATVVLVAYLRKIEKGATVNKPIVFEELLQQRNQTFHGLPMRTICQRQAR